MRNVAGGRTSPTVSVVLPTFNQARLLREAVTSVIAQTYRDWELIVMDDGSTDETREMLGMMQNARLRLIGAEHCGNPAKLRNGGVRVAAGRYIAFLDSDDLWMRTKLEAQLAYLNRLPAHRWCCTHLTRIDQHGAPLPLPSGKSGPSEGGVLLPALLALEAVIVTSSVVVERAFFDSVGGFDENLVYCQDYDLWIRLTEHEPVGVVPIPLVAIRSHPDAHTMLRASVEPYWLRVYQKVRERSTDEHVRRLCRVESGWARIRGARAMYGERRYLAGLRLLCGAPPPKRLWWSWMKMVAKGVVRPLVPDPIMRVYHSLRRRSVARA